MGTKLFFSLNNSADKSFNIESLSESERQRYKSISSEVKQREFRTSRVLLESILNSAYQVSLKNFRTLESGRPVVDSIQKNFSMSHSKGYYFFGFSDQAIGVDIENKNASKDFLAIAKRYFSKEEFVHLSKITDASKQMKDFYGFWTLRESLYKAYEVERALASLKNIRFDLRDNQGSFEDKKGVYKAARFLLFDSTQARACTCLGGDDDLEIFKVNLNCKGGIIKLMNVYSPEVGIIEEHSLEGMLNED